MSRSDAWYMGRIGRVINDDVKKYVINALKHRADISIDKKRVVPYIKEGCSTFFSGNYFKFERFIRSDLLLSRTSLPNEEYIANFFEIGSELLKLVELIKERSALSLEDLEDKEIDELFLTAYQDKESFTALCLDFSRSAIELLRPPTEAGAFPLEKLTELETRLKFDECTLPYINRYALHNL